MKQIFENVPLVGGDMNFLEGCFSKPVLAHVKEYVSGLICVSNKSVKSISEASFRENSHSNIAYALSRSKVRKSDVVVAYCKKLKRVVRNEPVSIVFDDTISEHEGDCIEGVKFHKSHGGNGYCKGQQFVTGALLFGKGDKWDFPVLPELFCDGSPSKIELAKKMFESLSKELVIDQVRVDSWYASKDLISFVLSKGSDFLCRIKKNRSIKIKYQKAISVENYAKKVKLNKKFYINGDLYRATKVKASLKGIKGTVVISKQYNRKKKKWNDNFYIFSTKKGSAKNIIRAYKNRWKIETMHRDLKQNLGFNHAQLRTKNGVERHAILSTTAHLVLKLIMFRNKLSTTIGECIKFLIKLSTERDLMEIANIDDKKRRITLLKERIIREPAILKEANYF